MLPLSFAAMGLFVLVQPLAPGSPLVGDSAVWFADGFAGATEIKSPGDATYRPTGLAEGPDGALYITEDNNGRIWRVTYRGD